MADFFKKGLSFLLLQCWSKPALAAFESSLPFSKIDSDHPDQLLITHPSGCRLVPPKNQLADNGELNRIVKLSWMFGKEFFGGESNDFSNQAPLIYFSTQDCPHEMRDEANKTKQNHSLVRKNFSALNVGGNQRNGNHCDGCSNSGDPVGLCF